MACSYCAALDAEVDKLRRAPLPVAPGPRRHSLSCAEAALEANLREIERLGVGVDGDAQQLVLEIEARAVGG